jgi:hypothetical protein
LKVQQLIFIASVPALFLNFQTLQDKKRVSLKGVFPRRRDFPATPTLFFPAKKIDTIKSGKKVLLLCSGNFPPFFACSE